MWFCMAGLGMNHDSQSETSLSQLSNNKNQWLWQILNSAQKASDVSLDGVLRPSDRGELDTVW